MFPVKMEKAAYYCVMGVGAKSKGRQVGRGHQHKYYRHEKW